MTTTRRATFLSLVLFALSYRCLADSWAAPGSAVAHTWGGTSTDSAATVAVDSFGNVYVAGYTESYGSQDVLITKYNSSGTFQWAKTWGGAGDEYAASIKVRPDGYLYVTGATSSFGAGWYDLFLLQLDTDGNLKWGTTWGGTSYDAGYDIAFDAVGNIYVVGESYSTSPCCAAILLKFSTAGALLQPAVSYKGPASYDSGYSLTVDSEGDVIIAGISWDYSIPPLHNSILLLKYGPNSTKPIWQENWSSTFPAQDESDAFQSLATDGDDNIYVGGRHSADCQTLDFSTCDFDALVLKLDKNGVVQWAKTWGTAGTYDTAGSVALGSNGNVLVAGMDNEFGADGGSPSLFTLSYDTEGHLNPFSQTTWANGTIQQGSPAGMILDSSKNAYATSSALSAPSAPPSTVGYWTLWTLPTVTTTLTNPLTLNSYSPGTPDLPTSPLTNQTVSQTGVQDTGAGESDLFVANVVRGNGLDLAPWAGYTDEEQDRFWRSAKNIGIEFAVIDFYGGGANPWPAAKANLLGAQRNKGIATAANILLSYHSDLPVTQQLEIVEKVWQSIGLEAQSQLKFMVVDVEADSLEGLIGVDQRIDWIRKAVAYVRTKHVKPVIYASRDEWQQITGNCNKDTCPDLISLSLWSSENCAGLGIIGLNKFAPFPPPTNKGWKVSHGHQYACNEHLPSSIGPVVVDLDYFDPVLFQ